MQRQRAGWWIVLVLACGIVGFVAWDAWQASRDLEETDPDVDARLEGLQPQDLPPEPVALPPASDEGVVVTLALLEETEGEDATLRLASADQAWTLPMPGPDATGDAWTAWLAEEAEPVLSALEQAVVAQAEATGVSRATVRVQGGDGPRTVPNVLVIRILDLFMRAGIEDVGMEAVESAATPWNDAPK